MVKSSKKLKKFSNNVEILKIIVKNSNIMFKNNRTLVILLLF